MNGGIGSFISEEALLLHSEYLKSLKLRYSVMEKSYPEVKNTSIGRNFKMRGFRYKDEAVELRAEIICHELFFDSFGNAYQASRAVREAYRTESSFIYEVFKLCSEGKGKFAVISTDRGTVNIKELYEAREILKIPSAVLCIDLCEHSYFLDYGFDKERYISNLLPYLNLGVLDKILDDKH